MVSNRRRGEDPLPANYAELLTEEQHTSLRKLESFGWSLRKIRRPKFEEMVVILAHSDGKSYAILTPEGDLDQKTPVHVREEKPVQLDASDALTTVARETFSEDKVPPPPPPPSASPMAEPLPSSTNDSLPDSADKPPPKYLV
jgi:hypothetical protein